MVIFLKESKLGKAVAIGFMMLVVVASPLLAADHDPMASVKQTVDEVLALLKDPVLAKAENRPQRQAMIKKTIDRRFDYHEMSRQTLARHWPERTLAEQEEFVKLFSKLLERTYITKIESYSNEEILFREQLIKQGKALVRSVIVKTNEEIPIIYKLKQSDSDWLVYDVVIEGVSMVKNYRTQFESIITKEKYAGLLKRIEEKNEKGETS